MSADDAYFDHLTGHGGLLYRGPEHQIPEKQYSEQSTADRERKALIAFLEEEVARYGNGAPWKDEFSIDE